MSLCALSLMLQKVSAQYLLCFINVLGDFHGFIGQSIMHSTLRMPYLQCIVSPGVTVMKSRGQSLMLQTFSSLYSINMHCVILMGSSVNRRCIPRCAYHICDASWVQAWLSWAHGRNRWFFKILCAIFFTRCKSLWDSYEFIRQSVIHPTLCSHICNAS